jgi:hypothetical protein
MSHLTPASLRELIDRIHRTATRAELVVIEEKIAASYAATEEDRAVNARELDVIRSMRESRHDVFSVLDGTYRQPKSPLGGAAPFRERRHDE